jgi:hypothetical protein
MLDAPQALAAKGASCRECERLTSAAGKTGDRLPPASRPYAGFIRSSLELFTALHREGDWESLEHFTDRVGEAYPGNAWWRLAGCTLPKKSRSEGRRVRHELLRAVGVRFASDELLTHDQYDACLCALIAATAHGAIPEARIERQGIPLYEEPAGTLREGMISRIRLVGGACCQRIHTIAEEMPSVANVNPPTVRGIEDEHQRRAQELLVQLVSLAKSGDAVICTYKAAFEYIFSIGYTGRGQGQNAARVAASTEQVDLPGLGFVGLDALIVTGKTRLPGEGHWELAEYDQEHWIRALGTAGLVSNGTQLASRLRGNGSR